MELLILISVISPVIANTLSANISQPFKFGLPLDSTGSIYLRWTPSDGHVTFQLEAKTQGYVGFGLSPDGAMPNSDILLAFFDATGQPRILDMFATGRWKPELDTSQDYVLENARKNDSHIVFQFSRKWTTCDSKDINLNKESNKIIWAVDDTPPVERDGKFDFSYHGKWRGLKFLYLNSPIEFDRSSLAGAKVWNIESVKATFENGSDTTYLCKIVKFPEVSEKHHIIAYEPVIPKEYLNYDHHVVFYACQVGSNAQDFHEYLKHKTVTCFGEEFPPEWNFNCMYVTLGWAVGSKGYNEPSHIGMPIHPNRDYFYMFEAHFDNIAYIPDIQPMIGFKVYYTNELRKYDNGFLTIGADVNKYTVIPPGQKSWKILTHFTGESFDWNNEKLIDGGIKVYAIEHHTHLLGTQIYAQHIRNGTELEPLTQDLNYNFNFQSTLYLSEEKTILPGDTLLVTCVYDSSKLSKPTFGGYETTEEMCLVFLHYYPRSNLGVCVTQPAISVYRDVFNLNLSTNEFYTVKDGEISFREFMARPENQKKDKLEKFQKSLLQGRYISTCITNVDSGKMDIFKRDEVNGNHIYKRLPTKTECKNQGSTILPSIYSRWMIFIIFLYAYL